MTNSKSRNLATLLPKMLSEEVTANLSGAL
mgnify:CR=1 FL=1